MFLIARGQGFHILEASNAACIKGERASSVPGSKSVAGKSTVHIGTWESRVAPDRSFQQAEKARRKYGDTAVGLTHSRGVGRVMPAESRCARHSKGSALIRKDEVGDSPIAELEETMITLQRLTLEMATRHTPMSLRAIKESINEEPDEGNLRVRFCEGHASPYPDFIKTLSLVN